MLPYSRILHYILIIYYMEDEFYFYNEFEDQIESDYNEFNFDE